MTSLQGPFWTLFELVMIVGMLAISVLILWWLSLFVSLAWGGLFSLGLVRGKGSRGKVLTPFSLSPFTQKVEGELGEGRPNWLKRISKVR